jgi:GxxExxY protein
MPIIPSAPIVSISKQEFYDINHVVHGLSFDIHNEFGRLLDEVIYKRELAARCRKAGLELETEFNIRLVHESYIKDYLVDILIRRSVPVEAKTATSIVPPHRSQTMNYLYIGEMHFATLLNFRPISVGHEFVTTHHTHASRRPLSPQLDRWRVLHPRMQQYQERLCSLVEDWGMLLDIHAYREAMTFFMGGTDQVLCGVDLLSKTVAIGQHTTHLLTEDIAFATTTVNRSPANMRDHLHRFLSHTRLQAIAWVNLHKTQPCFETILR